ncbi:unnamed protein product [Onchocerca flexuosa]|uniref:Glyceraldehyde-3-phosphate dehydrogenase n=1 Tax=Onchocerca flexuosa TaxID=387005 RepID=A0A183HBH8_9BILA|nr:unnamed protein product [Onchocerca flexuosa]
MTPRAGGMHVVMLGRVVSDSITNIDREYRSVMPVYGKMMVLWNSDNERSAVIFSPYMSSTNLCFIEYLFALFSD